MLHNQWHSFRPTKKMSEFYEFSIFRNYLSTKMDHNHDLKCSFHVQHSACVCLKLCCWNICNLPEGVNWVLLHELNEIQTFFVWRKPLWYFHTQTSHLFRNHSQSQPTDMKRVVMVIQQWKCRCRFITSLCSLEKYLEMRKTKTRIQIWKSSHFYAISIEWRAKYAQNKWCLVLSAQILYLKKKNVTFV